MILLRIQRFLTFFGIISERDFFKDEKGCPLLSGCSTTISFPPLITSNLKGNLTSAHTTLFKCSFPKENLQASAFFLLQNLIDCMNYLWSLVKPLIDEALTPRRILAPQTSKNRDSTQTVFSIENQLTLTDLLDHNPCASRKQKT